MYLTFGEAVRLIHENGGPQHVRIETHRFYEHVGVGRDDWREQRDLNGPTDPLQRLAEKCTSQAVEQVNWAVATSVELAFRHAEEAPWPQPM